MNVRHLLILIIPLLLSSCASFSLFGDSGKEKSVEVTTVAKERTKLNIGAPEPLKVRDLEWIVVTPDNINEVWKKLEEQKDDLVLFAITDNGYEALSLTMAEIRNYIATQRAIIVKYKEYYEKDESRDTTKGSPGSSN